MERDSELTISDVIPTSSKRKQRFDHAFLTLEQPTIKKFSLETLE